MSISELQPLTSPESSSGKPTLYTRLVGRHFCRDNAQVWLSLCAALPPAVIAFGPLIVRRILRFASSEYAREPCTSRSAVRSALIQGSMMWLPVYTLVRSAQYDDACKADKDLAMLRRVSERMAYPYSGTLHLLFWNQGAGEPSEGTTAVLGEHKGLEGTWEKAAMGLSWLLVPSTSTRIMRAAIDADMRQRNISQHDIDVTVSFLAGAMEGDKYIGAVIAALAAMPAVFVLNHFEKLGRWRFLMPALNIPVFALHFQERWLSMYIRDKPAVAAFLKERLRIS